MTNKLQLTPLQVATLANANDLWEGWDLIRAVAISGLESGYDAYARNVNDHDPTKPSYMSEDRGLMQNNSYWVPKNAAVRHVYPTIGEANEWTRLTNDPVENLRIAFLVWQTNGGANADLSRSGWHVWNTYTKLDNKVMHDARIAVNAALDRTML